jgi:hypothetical protein
VLRLIAVTALLSACGPSINGVPVECRGNIDDAECVDRATVALQSLPPEHPPVRRVVVTCDDDLCDADEGFGQAIVQYTTGEQEVIDFGFGHT